jgi:hypothetical protein
MSEGRLLAFYKIMRPSSGSENHLAEDAKENAPQLHDVRPCADSISPHSASVISLAKTGTVLRNASVIAISVSSPGRIEALAVQEGEAVKKGAPL